MVDPIDGTRPAMAGLESACVAVALAPLGDGEPTMADVSTGCVVEIKSGDWFLAARGPGVDGAAGPCSLSANRDPRRMFWSYGFRGRPARATVEVLAELIDGSSVRGGTFELGSQAFSMTRVVTGQLDAVIEVGSRMIDDVPGMRERVRAGRRRRRCSTTRPTTWRRRGCACARPAASSATAGASRSTGHRLLGAGHEFQMSSISAAKRGASSRTWCGRSTPASASDSASG